MLTEQEKFDIIADGLLKQNKRCTRFGHCVLINEANERCSLGFLLPKDWTYENWPAKRLDDVEDYFTSIGAVFTDASDILEGALLTVHNYHEPAEWPEALKKVATRFELNASVVDNFTHP